MKRTVLPLIVTLAVTGCATFSTDDYNLPVQVGMTERQLTDALGKPDVVTKKTDGSQVWVYPSTSGSTPSPPPIS